MRDTRILSYALNPPAEADDGDRVGTNLELVLELLDDAAAYDPDFVCFPEYVLQLRYRADGLAREEVARPIPGPETDAVAERAAALDSYVWLPTLQREGDRIYNAVALITPAGDVAGVAHKIAPTIGEIEEGTSPGEAVRAWDTPFGRVAAGVCWDERYPELGVRFAEQDADLVFHPTTGTASRMFRTWATYYGYHHVTCDKSEAWVTTPTGSRLAYATSGFGSPTVDLGEDATAGVSFAVANTDCGTYGAYQSRDAVGDVRAAHGGDVAFHEVPDASTVVIESLVDDLTVADLEAAFDLEPMFDYEERTRERVRAEAVDSPLLPSRK